MSVCVSLSAGVCISVSMSVVSVCVCLHPSVHQSVISHQSLVVSCLSSVIWRLSSVCLSVSLCFRSIFVCLCLSFCLSLSVSVRPDPVVGIIIGVVVHQTILKLDPINSAWSKTNTWTPRPTFNNVRELSYTLKWPWTMLFAMLLVLVYIWQFWNMFQ